MKKLVCSCDLCKKEYDYNSRLVYHIKVKSSAFIEFYDQYFADTKIIDICEECIKDFQEYIKNKNTNNPMQAIKVPKMRYENLR